MKITRIGIYQPRKLNPTFNQSDFVVAVETDEGITGIGEGGTPDTLTQCGAMLIGEDPARIQHLWQLMYRGFFYPPGREKLHALGGLDLALWDIKGKRLGVPVYDLLGGRTRDFVECYSTAYPSHGTHAETAASCIAAGFRAFRTTVAESGDGIYTARRMVERTVEQCRAVREGIGPNGEFAIDFHTRLDSADSIRLCGLLEELNPLFVEDPLRSENPGALAALRAQVKTPLAVGEHYGDRWDINELIEKHVIDYARVTLPNVGGITEMVKIAALCETHYVGMVPHFTGPISLAALVHVLCSQPVPALMEIVGTGPNLPPHLSRGASFKEGKLHPTTDPGLGVVFDPNGAEKVGEITQRVSPIPLLRRPDGSLTNW